MNKILIVEDDNINIDILVESLKETYDLSIAKDGISALSVANDVLPDLILMDIEMPQLSGIETLKAMKEIEKIKKTPVIFLTSHLDIGEKKKAFKLGAVDYITKPYDTVELKTRVEAHLALSSSKKETEDLLSKTLVGAMQMLMDIYSDLNPIAYEFSTGLRLLVRKIAIALNVKDYWKIELAGMLSLVGVMTVPPDVVKKHLSSGYVKAEYEEKFENHPCVGASLVRKIPRFSDVATIIEKQEELIGFETFNAEDTVQSGIQILKVVSEFEKRKLAGHSVEFIIKSLASNKLYFNKVVLDELRRVEHIAPEIEVRYYKASEIVPGSVINEFVVDKYGNVVIEKGTQISENMIKRLGVYVNKGYIKDAFKIDS